MSLLTLWTSVNLFFVPVLRQSSHNITLCNCDLMKRQTKGCPFQSPQVTELFVPHCRPHRIRWFLSSSPPLGRILPALPSTHIKPCVTISNSAVPIKLNERINARIHSAARIQSYDSVFAPSNRWRMWLYTLLFSMALNRVLEVCGKNFPDLSHDVQDQVHDWAIRCPIAARIDSILLPLSLRIY